ncbi:MAG: polysaccharide biosynthesis tyrosine autokinase [Chloroflexi bacterium]|nr:polysaccharide biosynthesis tyrosine autokinase [Chloroflexota bacterium]
MELKDIFSVIRKWWWLMLLATLIAAVFSYFASLSTPKLYQTSTTLMVGQFIQNPNPTGQDFYASTQLAQTYAQMVKRQPMLTATSAALGMGDAGRSLGDQVSAAIIAGTQLLEIRVVDTDPKRAQVIADELARQLILQSPSPEKETQKQRDFVTGQAEDLQNKIKETQGAIDKLQSQLTTETGARGVQDLQSQINGLQQKVTTWQGNYASLLTFLKGGQVNFLSVVDPAPLPARPFSPNVRLNVLLASLVGLLLASGGAFLLEYLDDTVKTGEDVERHLGVPALGAIGRIQDVENPKDQLVTLNHPRSPISEGYRVLRTGVQFSSVHNPGGMLMVTSAMPSEGKTTTISNLAISMAQAGKRVILVDTDLRRPSVHRIMGMSNGVGLTNLILDPNMKIEDALQPGPVESLSVLTSGPLPPNPAELLGSPEMHRIMDGLQSRADMVLFDSPPILAVADASILGGRCAGVLLVVDAGRTRTDMARRAKETLDQVGIKVLGVVLNKIGSRHGGSYYYYYYSSDDSGASASNGKVRKGTGKQRGFSWPWSGASQKMQ